MTDDQIPPRVREIVEQRLGPVTPALLHQGEHSDLTVTLDTQSGERVFLKAVNLQRPRARDIELRVQEYLPPLAPRLLWSVRTHLWLLMCFEHIEGRYADLAPDSPDLPRITEALADLSGYETPDLPVARIQRRWEPFGPAEELYAFLGGDTLVHTDLASANILVGEQVRFVDWAWPSVGAPCLDTALMVPRLIQAGHIPAAAENWAHGVPAFAAAPRDAVDFLVATRLAFARYCGANALEQAIQQWRSYRRSPGRRFHRHAAPWLVPDTP